ncbi:hypothetical protein AJ79_04664 [Helicocarpus griseus UAMH5409]|uniref:GAR domain-containing protein n=1 Tax=Helicocarpus griseus UAMH5409 TaxID=1447875 RepID=A0A2B7XSM1_9EURO|nr:hypothetical protein AJ79_04664 [Helicocarpus griseus UAMH5409]
MAENPFTTLTPSLRLHPSTDPTTPTRSPPRSPTRPRTRPPDRTVSSFTCASDPLLANLSPESTLAALSATDAVRTNGRAESILSKAIAEATSAERGLAVRAAVIGQKLKQWHAEVLSWGWPQKRDAGLGKGFIPPKTDRACSDDGWKRYLGCLPAAIVEQHEGRIEAIKSEMETLDVEELKEHVLDAHIPSRSRPSSSNSTWSTNTNTLSYVQLSDFTAVITATILQALPYLSKLNILLNIWEVRLTVLHQIPGLLDALGRTKADIDGALDRLKTGLLPELEDPLFTKSSYGSIRHKLEDKVLAVGGKMDRILDSLEGQEDALPDSWIDDMEAIEAGFATWAFEAEKMAAENDFRRLCPPQLATKVESIKTKEPEEKGRKTSTTHKAISEAERDQNDKESNSQNRNELPTRALNELEPPETPNNPDPVPGNAGSSSPIVIQRNPPSPLPVSNPPEHPNTPSHPDPTSSNVASPSSIVIHRTPPSPPLRPQIRSSDICKHQHSVGENTHTDSSAAIKSNEEKLNIQNAQDLSSPRPSTPTKSITHKKITTPSSPCISESVEKQQNNNNPLELSTKPYENHVSSEYPESAHLATPEKPSRASLTATSSPHNPDSPPEYGSQGNTTSVAVSFSNSSPEAGTNEPATPRSPQPNATPHASPYNVAYRSISSSPMAADSSPNRLSKSRTEALKLDTISRRRDSIVSLASTIGSGFSYGSNPEIQHAQVAESHGSPIIVESPGGFFTNAPKSPWAHEQHGDNIARTKSNDTKPHPASPPRPTVQRTMSLPLERFIEGDSEINRDMDEFGELKDSPKVKKASSASIEVLPKTELRSIIVSNRLSMGPPDGKKSMPDLRRTLSSASLLSDHRFNDKYNSLHPSHFRGPRVSTSSESLPSTAEEPSPPVEVSDCKDDVERSVSPAPPSLPPRSSKRLSKLLNPTASVSSQKQKKVPPPLNSALFPKDAPGKSIASPSTTPRLPQDHLEEKISSILTTIPARIHLASEPESNNSTPRAPEIPFSTPRRERLRSESPVSTRSNTPTPSLTLTPAFSRSRRHHAHHDDDSAIRLYHLHRGGKSAPVKLFVRSVGEDGERVMVRVGGGWADLGEYLREYAVHHGRRNVSDGKFEVRGLPNTSPPNYTSQSKLAPVRGSTGRTTPVSRPGSAFEIRPPSSLSIRKTRRSVTPSDAPTLTAANIEKASENPGNSSTSGPFSFFSSARRRLSTSSNASMSVASAYGSEYASTPLGLAGPNPKSRQVSISPESEAWVEDVIGRARRTSATLRSERSYGNLSRFRPDVLQEEAVEIGHRSVSDTGAGSKRVYLRGLERGRDCKD